MSPSSPAARPPDLGVLYQQHGRLVLRRIQRFYRDPTEAEDVLQEVFLRAMEKMHTFRGDASPSTWLYQMTTRYCINRLRNSSRRRELLDEQNDALYWSQPVSRATQEEQALMRNLWRVLDEDLVEIGIYYHLDGMTHDEISRIVGCSRRTVGNRLIELERQAKAQAGEAP